MKKEKQKSTVVYAKLNVEAVHNWTDCHIAEVEYLKHVHRHNFGIVAYVNVTHSNRDVEFIELQHLIRDYLQNKYYSVDYRCLNFGSQSCEMIAHELIDHFSLSSCEVNEDNENGAIVTVLDQ